MDYPIWDVAIGGGMLMALVAIPHVIVAHFAIGGGLILAVSETLAVRRRDPELRELVRRSSLILILVSTVFGAISGVGIWVVAGLISPGAISALIHTYVWGWAIEWVFFILEIVSALVYYATWDKISQRAHLLVIWLYFIAAYLSLVIINGIITFMLTPGRWLETGAFWDGFFNPTYWPSLVLRTGICLMMASAFLLFAVGRSRAERRPAFYRYLGWWMAAGALVSYAGYRWWEAMLPESVRAMFRAGQPLIQGLDTTRSLVLWTLAGALLLAVVVLIAMPRTAGLWVACLVAVLGFLHFGSYERLRESVRKPFLIHSTMFSNGLHINDIGRFNDEGMRGVSGWVDRAAEEGDAGRQIFRAQCASCHTIDGYLGIRELLPSVADVLAVAADDPPGSSAAAFDAQCVRCHSDASAEDMRGVLPTAQEIADDPGMVADFNQGMVAATIGRLRAMGDAYSARPRGEMIDTSTLDIPYMPPFVGSDDDAAALTDYLASLDTRGADGSGGGQ